MTAADLSLTGQLLGRALAALSRPVGALERAEQAIAASAARFAFYRNHSVKLGAEVILNDLQAGLPNTFRRALSAPPGSVARRQAALAMAWRDRFGVRAPVPTRRMTAMKRSMDRVEGAPESAGEEVMTDKDMRLLCRQSAEIARRDDEIAFLRNELAKETARKIKTAELVSTAADHLSKCRVTAGQEVRYLQPRLDKAALHLIAALMLKDAVLPPEESPIDLTEELLLDGGNVA